MSEPTTEKEQTPGKRLAAWREANQKSQTECAKKVDVRQATWSDWEADRKNPQIKYAIRIARMTDGAVPVECWEPLEPTETEKTDAESEVAPAEEFPLPPAASGDR